MRTFIAFLKQVATSFVKDDAPTLAGALAFYAALSLAPLLLVMVSVTGLIGGDLQERIVGQVEQLAGEQASGVISAIITNARQQQGASLAATLIGIGVSLFSGTGVFVQLRYSLNRIWGVQSTRSAFRGFIWERGYSVLVVLGAVFLLLASMVAAGIVNVLLSRYGAFVPIVNYLTSALLLLLAFAMLFRYLPAMNLPWRDVWLGAGTTAILMLVGRYLTGLYLQFSSTGPVYGAAGSLVVLLLIIYYSALIIFLGAEFTQAYSCRFGSRATLAASAEWTKDAAQKQCPPQEEEDDEG